MLGWSIRIRQHGEQGRQLLYAETTSDGIDRDISARAIETLETPDREGAGFGFPNRYLVHNGSLPRVSVYRYEPVAKGSSMFERHPFDLAPLPGIPDDEVLWVELWDLN